MLERRGNEWRNYVFDSNGLLRTDPDLLVENAETLEV
jgi:hypothetical protein